MKPTHHLHLMACASLLVLGGCTVLPNSTNVSKSPWATYDEAHKAFYTINTDTDRSELVALGFDPAALPNTRQLNYVDVVNLFGASFKLDDLPPGVKACVAARDACQGYVIRTQNFNSKRDGNIPADLLGFRKRTRTTGWEFSATLVLVNDTVVYKLWNGTPNVESLNHETNPLGPMQNLSGIIPKPF